MMMTSMRRAAPCFMFLICLFVLEAAASEQSPARNQLENASHGCPRGAAPSGCEAQIAGAEKTVGQGYRIVTDAGYHLGRVLTETPDMKLGPNAAPWLPRILEVIKKNRPPRYVLFKAALITGDRGVQYLALKWSEGDGLPHYRWPLEFHKVVRPGDGGMRLKWLRSYWGDQADLITPTGQVVFREEPPVAVVHFWDGGSSALGTELRLIQFKRNTVDITPDWAGRLVDIVDLDGDGNSEVVVAARGFHNRLIRLGHYISLPAILSRVDGFFRHDCVQYADAFASWIKFHLEAARPNGLHPTLKAGHLSGAFVASVQTGEIRSARALLGMLRETLAASPQEDFTVEQVLEDHLALIRWAEDHPEEPCPASAPGFTGGPHGILENVPFEKLPRREF